MILFYDDDFLLERAYEAREKPYYPIVDIKDLLEDMLAEAERIKVNGSFDDVITKLLKDYKERHKGK